MRRSSLRAAGLILAVMMLIVLAVGPVYAQQTGATQYTLQPGQSAEWIFQYLGNTEPAVLQLSSDQNSAIGMNVYTQDQWASLASDSSITPVGKGTTRNQKNSDGTTTVLNNGDLFWQTDSSAPGTFHVQVVSTSQTPIHYTLTQTGAGAGGLAPAAAVSAAAQQPAATAMPAATAAAAAATAPAPTTLPRTGGSEYLLLLGAGSALVAAGWLARRRAS